MQLQIDVNNTYKVISDKKINYDDELINDLSMLGDSLKNTKNGLGNKTSTVITVTNVEVIKLDTSDDTVINNFKDGLEEIQLIKQNKLSSRPLQNFLNEL